MRLFCAAAYLAWGIVGISFAFAIIVAVVEGIAEWWWHR